MKHTLIKSLVILLAMPLSAYADGDINEYHFDSKISYTRLENDFFDTNHWGTSLEYYWNPITYSRNYPNKEVAFVNRLGSAGIRYRGAEGNDDIQDFFSTNLGIKMHYAAKDFNHVFQINYDWTNSESEIHDTPFDSEIDSHLLDFGYQYYLLDNLTVGAGFKVGFFDDDFENENYYAYEINTKYLLNMGNQQWLTLTGSYEYEDVDNDSHTIGASAEYYFTPQTSLKLAGDIAFRRSSDSGFVELSATHYFVDQFALYTGFGYNINDGSDAQRYTIGVNYRF
ncbi:MAG: hypothetical protein V3U87_07745 [Methylococcaceae bacterium]